MNRLNSIVRRASWVAGRDRRIFAVGAVATFMLSVALICPARAQLADVEGSGHDLTNLSLEDLYNLDVVQLNVIGGHTHPAGERMVGYEFMFMNMDGHRDGMDDVSEGQILKKFPSTSTGMTVEEHMLEVMYAPTGNLTIMAMLPIKRIEMDMRLGSGFRFTERSDGVSDLQLMALYTVLGSMSKGQRLLIDAGMSFPTGSIDETNTISGLGTFRLEYPMQLGSGTFDLRPGLTYLGEWKKFAWGAQALTTLRLGRNDNGYRFGNEYEFMGWLSYAVTDWFAPSLRMTGRIWENVHGADPRIDPTFDPEGDPNRQGGRRADLFLGVNFFVPKGIFKRTRVNIEAGLPIYEDLDGPQLSTSWLFSAGVTYSF